LFGEPGLVLVVLGLAIRKALAPAVVVDDDVDVVEVVEIQAREWTM
jgi:hypothetical protein